MNLRQSGSLSTVSGLGAILLWSTTFALARSLSEQVGPITAGAAVYLIGGLLCLVRVVLSGTGWRRFAGLPRPYLLGCGFLFAFYTAAIYLAVGMAANREQLLEIALMNYLWPALTIVLSIPLLHKKAGPWLAAGTILALAGVLCVMTQGSQFSFGSFAAHLQSRPVAYLLAVAAAISWGLYSNLARRWSGPGTDGAVELFVPATGLVLLAIRMAITEVSVWHWEAIGEATALAAITSLSYGLWDLAMRKGNLLLVAACSYFTPLLSTAVSSLYLRVTPGPRLWLGCLLLVAGSLITWRSVSDGKSRAL